MAPPDKVSGATRMAGAHMFQAVQHPELDSLGLLAIRDFLKKRARYLRLVAQNNKADGVNVTPITVIASINPELLENLIDMEEIHIQMLRNYYTVPTRCRHRGGIVALGCKACRAIRQPISPSNQTLDHSIQNHPKPVSFLSSGI
jgi:hypothetical protein